MLSELGIIV